MFSSLLSKKSSNPSCPPLDSPDSLQTPKKKRNLPGTPDPNAEVIALSPKTLMATNRFVCEICQKGFQRDQNLQLHRRGHNVPWKLKQNKNKEVVQRKKVYICPEPGCVHNHPSRALGDLTGIKKHFCRKHGEKKLKCHKCSKIYAVRSDWKAHLKICGTKEYRCESCGQLFTRKDSLGSHKSFCEALVAESAKNAAASIIAAPNSSTTNISSLLQRPSFLNPLGSSSSSSNSHYRRFPLTNTWVPPPAPPQNPDPQHNIKQESSSFQLQLRGADLYQEQVEPTAAAWQESSSDVITRDFLGLAEAAAAGDQDVPLPYRDEEEEEEEEARYGRDDDDDDDHMPYQGFGYYWPGY